MSVDELRGHDVIAAMIKSDPHKVAMLVAHDRDDKRFTGDTHQPVEPITGSETEPGEGLDANFYIPSVLTVFFFVIKFKMSAAAFMTGLTAISRSLLRDI